MQLRRQRMRPKLAYLQGFRWPGAADSRAGRRRDAAGYPPMPRGFWTAARGRCPKPCASRGGDGETRNRTEDTTIFSLEHTGPKTARFAGSSPESAHPRCRWFPGDSWGFGPGGGHPRPTSLMAVLSCPEGATPALGRMAALLVHSALRIPSAPLLFDLSFLLEARKHTVEVVLLDAHLRSEFRGRDAGLALHDR